MTSPGTPLETAVDRTRTELVELRLDPEATVRVEAYLARPAGPSPDLPGVLFFMDAIGLRPQIAEMCARIASWGYVVLAPNVFHRDGRAAELAPKRDLREDGARDEFFAQAMPRVKRLTQARAEHDIPAYLAALRAQQGVGVGTIGVTGYCMGARLAIRAACLSPSDVVACGGFHGGGLATEDADSPHRGLAHASAEFVFGHAARDRSMTASAVATLGDALAAAGLVASNEVYPGTAHGYTMADTAVYDEPATERHFTELRDLFDRTLTAPDR